jgi:hypothetical protein
MGSILTGAHVGLLANAWFDVQGRSQTLAMRWDSEWWGKSMMKEYKTGNVYYGQG